MRLLAVHADEDPPGLAILLAWMAEAGHTVQRLAAPAVDAGLPGHLAALIRDQAPDLVVAHGHEPGPLLALAAAREADVATLLLCIAPDPPAAAFAHVDRVLVPSRFLADRLRALHGVVADTLPLPPGVAAPDRTPEFLTTIAPGPAGMALFARLADTLARTRPDIPMLVVAGDTPLDALTAALTPAARDQVAASPRLPWRDALALTRVLALPEPDAEGLLAQAATLAGVPVLAQASGASEEVVGPGGTLLPDTDERRWAEAAAALWDAPPNDSGRTHAARRLENLRERYEAVWLESF